MNKYRYTFSKSLHLWPNNFSGFHKQCYFVLFYKRYVQVDTQSAAVFVFLCASFGIVFFFVSNLSKRCQKPKNERANANKVEQRTNDSTNRNVFFALPILFSDCFWRSIEIKRMQEKVRVVWPYFIFVFVQRKC